MFSLNPTPSAMIIVIVNKEHNPKTGYEHEIVSHGFDVHTNQLIIMPNVHPCEVGAKFDIDIGEYVITE